MHVLRWSDADKVECWSERDPAGPSDFVVTETAAAHSCLVTFEIAPGGAVGTHRDSAEETLVVVSGEVEATIGDTTRALAQGDVAIVPADAPHRIVNRGARPARLVGVFAAPKVLSRFERPLLPFGLTELETPTPPS